MRRLLTALALAAMTACASAPRSTLEPLREAAARVEAGSSDASTLALAGWNALVDSADPARARKLADRAIEQAPADPWARLLRAELARRDLDPRAEVGELLELVERSPRHPLAMVAAGRLAGFTHRSPDLDSTIVGRVAPLLEREGVAGELRTRLRGVLRIARLGESVEAAAPYVAASGLVTAGSVVGPLSDYHALEAGVSFAPESASPVGPSYGTSTLRPFAFPTGTVSLRGEEASGDVYYVLAITDVPAGGRFAVRLATSASTTAAVAIDGTKVVERLGFRGPSATQAAQAIELGAGTHLVAIRVVRGRGTGDAWVAIAPADGSAANIRYRAAQPGDVPGAAPKLVDDPALRLGTDANALASALVDEAGTVGLYAAALDSVRRDPQTARRLVDRGLAHAPGALPLLALRAELLEDDSTLPSKIAQARAAADWDTVLGRDPQWGRALLAGANLLAGAGRHDEALGRLDALEKATPESSAPALARARVALARGFDAQALKLARGVAATGADRCAAWTMIYDLSKRADAVADTDEAVQNLAACGDRTRLAAHQATRGATAEALALARQLLEEDPQDSGAAYRLADLLAASGALQEAVQVLERQEAFWPRNAWLPRRRAELLERAGEVAGAKAARTRALSLHGGDLALRRMESLAAGHGDVLEDLDRDGLSLVRAFEKNPRHFDSPAVMLLDFGAVEVYEDGSYVEKVHTVAKVLDKRGIDEMGEVHLPGGADVIHLRTIKPDGRILVPEAIDGKDSISMPGLAVGDYVEQEYLVAYPSRTPALPGWSAAPFFFRTAGVPMLESTYVVRAHEDAGLELDVHNGMEGAAIEKKDGWLTVTLRRTDVPALVPEPVAPARREFLPWAQVGAGADEAQIFPLFADNLAGSAVPTLDVERWARETADGVKSGDALAIVRALYDRSMREIEGSDRGYGGTASEILARRRGNRAVLLKAALASLGIDARYAAVRTFEADPAPYRFPDADRWGYVALVVRPERDAEWIWLDPGMRWAPFGTLAPGAQGANAWVLPEPGEITAQRTTTPRDDGQRGRDTDLRLVLGADGALHGEGVERYLGFDGAAARNGLDQMDEERRRQAIEASLARVFPGLTLESLALENEADGVAVRYAFTVPGFARDLGEGRQLLRIDAFQANLGRRFLARSTRETPLLVAGADHARVTMKLELPEGTAVERGVDAAREHGPFGDYKRDVAFDGRSLVIRETLDMNQARVAPGAYADFAAWVSAVDRAQAVELVVRR